LPATPDFQRFELHEATQGRISAQLAIQLEPPSLFEQPGTTGLHRGAIDCESVHDILEGPVVFDDLLVKTLQEATEFGSTIVLRRPPRELEA